MAEKKDITLDGVRKAKEELETKIVDLLKAFEKDYDVKLGYCVNINRKESLENTEAKIISEVSSVEAPIQTVDVSMDIDII